MKVIFSFITYAIFMTMVAKITSGAMFDFYVTETSQNFTEQEKNCRDIGYDGLAVISTPEAFVYALQLIR